MLASAHTVPVRTQGREQRFVGSWPRGLAEAKKLVAVMQPHHRFCNNRTRSDGGHVKETLKAQNEDFDEWSKVP